ncbi:Uncharacterized protein TCAP_02693 [Tolypocladium capitatum]|uniref:Uncharacterized protein n=1 Tax=Tolypocladium capitatum TaxID=45235 RepID=A0A2K3QIM1_9HYPO|nr:Uncharacterized protein TCAP_02693 [Tolypocladium capitatum]
MLHQQTSGPQPDGCIHRKVVLQPDHTVIKSGKRIARRRLESPLTLEFQPPAFSTSDGQGLDKLWPDMSAQQRKDVARQLRELVERMRSVAPPPNLIGACHGTEIRDTRPSFTYYSPPCCDGEGFNGFLLSSLSKHIATRTGGIFSATANESSHCSSPLRPHA